MTEPTIVEILQKLSIKDLRKQSDELRAAYLDAKGELDDARAREAEAWRAWSAAFNELEKAENSIRP